MSNPSNQLHSYESDTITQANSSYFCGPIPVEIKHNQVVVKNENRRDEGSKQFASNCIAAFQVLNPCFGATKNFVQRRKDDKNVNAGNTNYTYTQDSFTAT